MHIGTAVTAIGATERDGEDVIVVGFGKSGKPEHYALAGVRSAPLPPDYYVATGRFAAGAVVMAGGRHARNLTSVWTLPIDSDVKDRIGANPRQLPPSEVDALLDDHLAEIVRVCKATGLQPNFIANTGYGFSLWYAIAPEDQGRVDDLRALHKRLVAVLNAAAGWTIADRQVSDAGTRIMRIPGSANGKGTEPRDSFIVHKDGGSWTAGRLTVALSVAAEALPPDVDKFLAARASTAPTNWSPVDLSASVAGEIASLVRAYWSDGQRHDLALGLAGWLKRNDVSEQQARSIIEECSTAGGDKRDHLAAVRTTYERADSGVAGWSKVREILPSPTVQRIDDLLTDFWRARQPAHDAGPQVVMSGKTANEIAHDARLDADDRYAIEFDPLPASIYTGAIGEYVRLMEPTTEAPVQYHVGCFLAIFGALAARIVYTRYASKQMYCNQYVLLVGATGSSKKDTAIDRATRHFSELEWSDARRLRPSGPRYALLDDASSDVALLKSLANAPTSNALLVVPELSSILSKMRRKGQEALFDRLLSLWDCKPYYSNNSAGNFIEVRNPTLGFLAGIQPTRLRNAANEEILSSGYLNRKIIIPGVAPRPIANPPTVDEVAARALLYELLDRLDDMAVASHGEPLLVPMSPAANDEWSRYYERDWYERQNNEQDGEIGARRPDLARKIALALAVTDLSREVNPVIEWDAHIGPAIEFIDWQKNQTRKLMTEWGGSDETRSEERIRASLHKNGPTTRRTLFQRTAIKNVPAAVWNRALDALTKSGAVIEVYALGNALALAGDDERIAAKIAEREAA